MYGINRTRTKTAVEDMNNKKDKPKRKTPKKTQRQLFGKDKNELPLGIQLLGKHYNEQEIFNAAYALEKDYE